jgi:hypothetical protein
MFKDKISTTKPKKEDVVINMVLTNLTPKIRYRKPPNWSSRIKIHTKLKLYLIGTKTKSFKNPLKLSFSRYKRRNLPYK